MNPPPSPAANFDAGLSLQHPSRPTEILTVWGYIWRHHRFQAIVLFLGVITVGLFSLFVDELKPRFFVAPPTMGLDARPEIC